MKFWTSMSLKLISLGEEGHSKTKKKSTQKKILPFVTQYHNRLALPNLKSTVMEKWHFIQNQWHSGAIFKEPPQS